MNTRKSPDPRALAHRLTTVGHALHHRLFAQLHDSGIHPKTLLLLSAVDGRIDAPWIADRLARGGKRVTGLADRGWIARSDDGVWSLTDEGRALLDRVDAERAALLAGVPAEQLAHLDTALDALAEALGIDEAETAGPGPRGGFRVAIGGGRRGFGPDPRRAFGPNEHHGFRTGDRSGAPGGPRVPNPGPTGTTTPAHTDTRVPAARTSAAADPATTTVTTRRAPSSAASTPVSPADARRARARPTRACDGARMSRRRQRRPRNPGEPRPMDTASAPITQSPGRFVTPRVTPRRSETHPLARIRDAI